MDNVVAVGFTDEASFILSLEDYGDVIIKKISDGRYGVFCNYSLTENQASVMDSRDTVVDYWSMPKVSKSEYFSDFRKRFEMRDGESITLEIRKIQQEIKQELFDSLSNELREKGFKIVYDEI